MGVPPLETAAKAENARILNELIFNEKARSQ